MYRDEKLEVKVGLFIGAGIFLMFMIVFSISDFYLFKPGYNISVMFDYVNGITENAPVRLAGVHVGEVKTITINYDEGLARTRVRLDVRINGNIRIEKDAVARINTLGLLGEQYLEISPGVSREFSKDKDTLSGTNPVNVGQQMESMSRLVDSISKTFQYIEKGEGTIGKLLMDDKLYNNLEALFGGMTSGKGTLGKLLTSDTLYDDLETIFGRLRRGEGTIGKLLVEEKVYNDLENAVSDIKQNPWKLLHKPKVSEKTDLKKGKGFEVGKEITRNDGKIN